jgi:carbon-monoxide dehydrogenase large subunit
VNRIPDEPRPFVSPVGFVYDTGSFGDQLDALVEAIGYDELRAKQERARAEGRYLGVGVASMVEATAPNLHGFAGRFGGFEMALATVQPDGHVSIAVGTKSQGQGHATCLAQVASEVLTVPLDWVDIREGDTGVVPYGMGTWGSRSAVMGGGAVLKATTTLREKMLEIAAHMLQVPRDEIELEGGMFRAGEHVLPFGAVAGAAYLHTFLLPPGMDMALCTVASYDPGNTSPFPDENGRMNPAATYATAAGAAVVEVDVNTGQVALLDAAIVHDCGRVINPMIVDGQIQGAFAQAVGAVLLEEIVYGEDGQLLTSSLLDYLIPAFGSVPKARIVHRETPSDLLGGFRGAGEAGIIVMPAAIANAVHDALKPLGVKITQTNLGATHVRALLRDAGVAVDPVAGARLRGLTVAAT